MIPSKAQRSRAAGAAVVEYALLIAVVSLGLVVNLPGMKQGFCDLGDTLAQMLGSAPVACTAQGAGGSGGPGGSGSGGGGSGGGGGGLTGNGGSGPGGGGGGGVGGGNGGGRGP